MSLLIDAHLHIFESRSLSQHWTSSYDIWEYGDKQVQFSDYDGTLSDAVTAMSSAGFSHALLANLFIPSVELDFAVAASPTANESQDTSFLEAQVRNSLTERLRDRNRWACDLVADDKRFSVLAAVDPNVSTPEANGRMIEQLAEQQKIIGIKLHPAIERYFPSDPRLDKVYSVCQELGLLVLSHSGSGEDEAHASPVAFGDVLQKFPRLKLQLAHLGGGEWRDTAAFAEQFPTVRFDLCEIIEWTDSPRGPTRDEFARLIQTVGSDRVHLGTDFPWYDFDRTAELVDDLPHLGSLEKAAIRGENVAEFLALSL